MNSLQDPASEVNTVTSEPLLWAVVEEVAVEGRGRLSVIGVEETPTWKISPRAGQKEPTVKFLGRQRFIFLKTKLHFDQSHAHTIHRYLR